MQAEFNRLPFQRELFDSALAFVSKLSFLPEEGHIVTKRLPLHLDIQTGDVLTTNLMITVGNHIGAAYAAGAFPVVTALTDIVAELGSRFYVMHAVQGERVYIDAETLEDVLTPPQDPRKPPVPFSLKSISADRRSADLGVSQAGPIQLLVKDKQIWLISPTRKQQVFISPVFTNAKLAEFLQRAGQSSDPPLVWFQLTESVGQQAGMVVPLLPVVHLMLQHPRWHRAIAASASAEITATGVFYWEVDRNSGHSRQSVPCHDSRLESEAARRQRRQQLTALLLRHYESFSELLAPDTKKPITRVSPLPNPVARAVRPEPLLGY